MSRTTATEPPSPDSTRAIETPNPYYAMARHVEVAAWTDLLEAAPPALRSEHGIAVEQSEDVTLLRAPGIDHPLLNRAWVASPDPERVSWIAARYRELGVERFMVHIGQQPDRPLTLGLGGLMPHRRNWVKLLGKIDGRSIPSSASALEVREAQDADAARCGVLFCDGFDMPEAAAPLLASVVGRVGWRVFVACSADQQVVAAGYLFLGDHIAYLAGATTAATHRRQGAQAALMAARIRAAFGAGCHFIASETGEPVEGEPQHSQRNMERYGMNVVGVTENLVPPGFEWADPNR